MTRIEAPHDGGSGEEAEDEPYDGDTNVDAARFGLVRIIGHVIHLSHCFVETLVAARDGDPDAPRASDRIDRTLATARWTAT
jgi:hypothetical protein